MALSYEDLVQGAYSSIGRTGMGNAVGQIDPEGYNFWLNALKSGAVSPDQLYANFNQAVASTIQQQPQAANSQAVSSYIAENPLATQIDPKKVLAIGDSTTYGELSGKQVENNMVTTAQKALGSDYSVSNLGINSTTAGDFLNSAAFDKALSSSAGTVVLNYGMNEAYRNEDPATFANNLATAVQTLQAVGKTVILQTPNQTGVSTKIEDAWMDNVGTYADVVRNVAQQTGTTLDDKFSYTSGLTNATSANDLIHPTEATYVKLGTNLADAIKTATTGVAPTAISVTPPATKPASVTPSIPTAVQGELVSNVNNAALTAPPTVTDYQGNEYNSNTILSLARELAPTMDAKNLAGGVYSTQGESIGFNYDEATKLLGHPPTAAEQVVLDMARQLNQTKGITSLSQLPATDTSTRFGSTYTGGGGTIYEIQKDPTTGAVTTSTWGKNTSDKGNIVAALSIGAGLLGIPTQLGAAILGTGANTLAAGALGGGLFGGAAAGLTGGDVLKGALMGAAGGAAGEYFRNPVTGEVSTVQTEGSVPFTGADYSLANGVGPQGLDTMGGAQGLQPGTSANLESMGGAQGITLNLGPASTTLANALATFGGMNPANLDAMGGGQGLTYQTPTGVVTQGGLITTGGMTGNNNVIGETGINTAYNIGSGIGDTLAGIDTGVYNPSGGMLSSVVTGTGTETNTGTTNTNTSTNTGTTTGSVLDNLTAGQIANIIAGVGGLVGGAAITSGGGTRGIGGVGALPTQGVPLNTLDYYRAIQQNYNRLLPAVPRDVATPLAQWYNSQYGA